MKKIIFYMMTMVFVLALGAAYASDKGGNELYNGVTDFTGRSYDTVEIGPTGAVNSVESESAGGLRAGDRELYNGVTDFTGRSYDTVEIGPMAAVSSVESESAGGLRAGDKELYNGVTDFTGRSYDTVEIGQ